jgi:hypothetical protein
MSAARSVSFPFQHSSTQTAAVTVVLDRELEQKMYMEVVAVLCDSDFDNTVMAVYSGRPERELPQAKDSRDRGKKYLFP